MPSIRNKNGFTRLKKGRGYKRLNRVKKFLLKRETLGVILIALGVSLVLLTPSYKMFLSLKERQSFKRAENLTEGQDFDHGPIKADAKLLAGAYVEDKIPTRIILPPTGIDISLRPAKVVKGKWEVFEDTGSFGLGSALPGEVGNTVVFAHARRGLFLPLRNVKIEDKVYLMTKDKWFSYKVKEIKEISPTDVSVIGPTDDETLTLYTCSGFADSKRLIVVAKRV